MKLETLDFSISNNIATITLNRPENANALNPLMAKELSEVAIECDENKEPHSKPYAFINGTPLHKREYKPPPPQPPPPRCALCLEDVKLDTMFTECAHMFCKSCCVRGHYLFDTDNLKSCPVCRTEQPSSSIKIALYPLRITYTKPVTFTTANKCPNTYFVSY